MVFSQANVHLLYMHTLVEFWSSVSCSKTWTSQPLTVTLDTHQLATQHLEAPVYLIMVPFE